MRSHIVSFNDYEIEFYPLILKDANEIFPFVTSSMWKMANGNYDVFKEINPQMISLFQEKICASSKKIKEEKTKDGVLVKVKNPLTILDLDEYTPGFLLLLFEFLEFNFHFFSQAPIILKKILEKMKKNMKNSDEEETVVKEQ